VEVVVAPDRLEELPQVGQVFDRGGVPVERHRLEPPLFGVLVDVGQPVAEGLHDLADGRDLATGADGRAWKAQAHEYVRRHKLNAVSHETSRNGQAVAVIMQAVWALRAAEAALGQLRDQPDPPPGRPHAGGR
jgi:hypothetical protein